MLDAVYQPRDDGSASPYRFKADRYSSHAQIALQIQRLAAKSAAHPYVVLDVGCAAGFLRAFLPQSDFYIIGLERDPILAEQARTQYDEVYTVDLNHALDVPIRQAHVVVFADILEHLPEPNQTLTSLLQRYIYPKTPIIISLPNVAHLYVRLGLLLGQFNYADRGILDRTHLRFFTLRTAKALCTESHIRLKSVAVTPVPLPLVHPLFAEGQPLFFIHRLSAFLASVFKGLLAFQCILSGVYEP